MARDEKKWLGNEFKAEVYFSAALERSGALPRLYDAADYVLTIYVAGVAVESLFRAFRARIDPEFDSRHDLYSLAKDAKFAELVPERLFEQYAANLGVVMARWSNNHRYRSEESLRRYLNRAGLFVKVKGDVLKENARKTVNSAVEIVTLGAQVWKN